MTDQQLRVLIVEDHQDTLKYLKLYLEQSGHAVQAARTLEEAKNTFAAAECDVLLSDIALSDGTGWELLSELERIRPVYAVAMSGFGMAEDTKRSKAAGFRHHLVKPIDPDLLDKALEEARREMERV
jgi:two-component system CheB/CheR fusion protein